MGPKNGIAMLLLFVNKMSNEGCGPECEDGRCLRCQARDLMNYLLRSGQISEIDELIKLVDERNKQ